MTALLRAKNKWENAQYWEGSNHKFSRSCSFSLPWRTLYERNESHNNIMGVQHSCLHHSSTSAIPRTLNKRNLKWQRTRLLFDFILNTYRTHDWYNYSKDYFKPFQPVSSILWRHWLVNQAKFQKPSFYVTHHDRKWKIVHEICQISAMLERHTAILWACELVERWWNHN